MVGKYFKVDHTQVKDEAGWNHHSAHEADSLLPQYTDVLNIYVKGKHLKEQVSLQRVKQSDLSWRRSLCRYSQTLMAIPWGVESSGRPTMTRGRRLDNTGREVATVMVLNLNKVVIA